MKCEHEFELVEGAEVYNSNLETLNERYGTNNTCREDYLEYEMRIWRWWDSRKHRLTHITKDVNLVALMQTSSAFSEKLFSQVKLVTNEIGEEALRESIKIRVMRRVRNYFMD